MAKLHLVWNTGMSECVGFLDEGDADYTATGDTAFLELPYMTPSLGDDFRNNYADEQSDLPQTVVEIPDAPEQP